ncbi:hypothetical protein CVT24_010099, partial [Panaeolus cyanescens]
LLSLPSSDSSSNLNASLTHQLQLLGLYAAPTLGDGNCLFRSLSDQVYGTPEKHAQVRREICDWIEKYGERYEGFVEGEGSGDDGDNGRGRRRREKAGGKGKEQGKGKALESYLRNMRENATYGGHMELSAFAHMTRRNVKVIQPGLVYVIEWDAWGGFEEHVDLVNAMAASSGAQMGGYEGEDGDEESDLTDSDESGDDGDEEWNGDDETREVEVEMSVAKAAMGGALGGIGAGLDSLSSLTSISTASTSTLNGNDSKEGSEVPNSTASTTMGAGGSPLSTPRRPTRSSLPLGSGNLNESVKGKGKDKDEAGKEKIKMGKGYYYLEEVTSDEEDGEERRVMDVEGVVGGAKVGDEVEAHRVEGVPKEVKMEVDADVKVVKKERKEKKRKEKKKPVQVQQPPRSKRESGGPTVYVAYHDWEHFSSIRNLRGPHVGLPNVQEMPAQSVMDAVDEDMEGEQQVHNMTPKERERERKREERKEKERRDAERRKRKEERRAKEREERALEIAREKERAANGLTSGVKIMLKLPRSGASSLSGSATPAIADSKAVGCGPPDVAPADPSLVPLPDSRDMTPLSGSLASQNQQDLDLSLTPTAVQPSQPLATRTSNLGSCSIPRSSTPHLVADRTQYRSPKRSFDESSASGGEEASGREGREGMKRSRRVVEEIIGGASAADMDVDADADVDVDGYADAEGGDTPGLSAPGSSSSASETSSEVASELSEGAGNGFGSARVHAKDATITPASVDASGTSAHVNGSGAKPVSSVSLPDSSMRDMSKGVESPKAVRKQHPYGDGEKQLTRRERKALGLPKHGSGGAVSAGKIVIPGGRFKGRMAAQAAANARAAAASTAGHGGVRVSGEGEDSEEWRRNGTGRLDVRGFRELKI